MSTEINVRVDRELLLQRDRVQRQAQRQFVLEKNGQKLVVNRSQELVAKSGAAGGENRIRTGKNGQRVPTVPVTAPYERKPLPELGGAASTKMNNSDSYLALPKQPQILTQTLNDSFLTDHVPGEALYGYKILCGKKLNPCYAVYLSEPSPESSRYHRPIPVVSGAWTPERPLVTEYTQNYTVFIRPKENLESGLIATYQAPTDPATAFTHEAIIMLGNGDDFDNTVTIISTYSTLYVRRSKSSNPGDIPERSILNLGITGEGSAYYEDTLYGPNPNITTSLCSVPTHVAVTLSQGVLAVYIGGVRWATVSVQSLIGSSTIPADDLSIFASQNLDIGGNDTLTMAVASAQEGGDYESPKVYSVRYTAGKALYTGASFTPPTSITRLA